MVNGEWLMVNGFEAKVFCNYSALKSISPTPRSQAPALIVSHKYLSI